MPFTKIVVAGSTGYLSDHVLPALLNSTKPKFDITVLTRINSGKTLSLQGAKVIPVDYEDHAALVRAVAGAEAILSLIAGTANKLVDLNLLRAAQEAGVRRIFPSEYTIDALHPQAVSLLTEGIERSGFVSHVYVARQFAALADEGGPTSFTTIVPSAFIDGWLEGAFGLFEPKNHKVTLLDGGNHQFTGCSLPFVAACIVAILQMDEEKTKNKRVHISEVRMTGNEVVGAYEEATGARFEKTSTALQALLDQRDEHLKAGEVFPAVFLGIQIAAFAGSGPGDLEDGLEFDLDGLLTVKRKTLKELTTEAVQKVAAVRSATVP
ncbi:isoflavone reductase [Seiridium cupressi]